MNLRTMLSIQKELDECSGDYEIKAVMKTHSDRSDKIIPELVGEGLELITESYIKCYEEVVLPWFKRVFAGNPYFWQPDSLPWPH